jgi:hypothetical protein
MDQESRTEYRSRTLKRGQVWIDGGKSLFECTIHDLTETGARLRFENVIPLPQQFELFIVDAEAGVEFFPTEIP